ncbi:hypothetical protein S83_009872, partial [Arachis hypogaea]
AVSETSSHQERVLTQIPSSGLHPRHCEPAENLVDTLPLAPSATSTSPPGSPPPPTSPSSGSWPELRFSGTTPIATKCWSPRPNNFVCAQCRYHVIYRRDE